MKQEIKITTNLKETLVEIIYIPTLTQNSPIITSGFVVGVCVSEAKISTSAFFKGNCSIGYQNT